MENHKNENPAQVIETGSTAALETASAQTSDDVAAAERAASEGQDAKSKAASDKAAAAEEKRLAKAAAEKKKQDEAAAKAAATDSETALRAIEDNTAEVVNTDPMVNIHIAKRTKEDTRAEVCINGHWWKLKKGEVVSVPRSVALILRESEKVLNENEILKGDFEAFTLTSL